MQFFISIINQILYFSWRCIDLIFQAFGLTWVSFTVGLAVVSVILRLFAGNLVGTAMNIRHDRAEAASQQRIEKRKAKSARGRGASYSTRLSRSDYDFSRPSGSRDHFINRIRRK